MGYRQTRVIEINELILTEDDYRKQRERRALLHDIDNPLLGWQRRFTTRLKKCPKCGSSPKLLAYWVPERGWECKYVCGGCPNMACGDWYYQLSRAGLDWNRRTTLKKYRIVPYRKIECNAYGRERNGRKWQ